MDYIIIAFRSRSHTIKMASFLKSNNIGIEIINTPKEAGVGCGLSVKMRKEHFSIAKKAVQSIKLSSFAGFFLVKNIGGRRIVKTI